MKKFLSAFLAVLMVLSMVATSMVTVFAADAEEVHSILVSNGEDIAADQADGAASQGWRNHKINPSVQTIDGQKAAAIEVVGARALTDVRFHYYSATAVDTTKWAYVEFDLYVADAAKLPAGYVLNVELTSGGKQDVDEMAKTISNADLKTGWNHIKLALADVNEATGNYNAAAWNFVRIFFSQGNFAQGAEDKTVFAIDNFGFSDGTEAPAEKVEPLPTPVVTPTEKNLKEIVLSNNATEVFYDITKPGWGVGGGGQEYGNGWVEKELDGKTGIATTLTGTGNVVTSRFHYYAVEPTDISGMTHFELDLYISDASVVNGKQFIIEIQDTGLWGAGAKSEIRYINNNAQFVNGWNHIKLSLNDDFKDRLGEGCPVLNRTEWQHCRVWFPDAAYTNANITYALSGLKFTNADYDAQSIKVPLVETTKPAGWNWAGNVSIKKTGASAVSTTMKANNSYGTAGAFNANFSYAAGLDTTGATNFRFWLYTDDAATLQNVQVELELTSGGTCDDHESAHHGTLNGFVEGGIKNGWNEVVIPLSALNRKTGGDTDWTKINFFRMYNDGFTTGANGMVLALDQLQFCKDNGDVVAVLSDCDVVTNWEGPTNPMVLDGETVIGNTWEPNQTLGAGWFMFRYGLNFEGKFPAAVDISGMKYIEFDLYVSDAMALINSGFSFELTGEGIQDKNESAYNWDGWRTSLTNGWNHVQWPLSWFNATTNGSCDFTAWNFLRMFNAKDLVVGANGLTVAMKNVEFTTGKYYALVEGETEKEIISFTPVQSDKDNQDNLENVVKITSGANAEKFYADATGEVIYRVPVSATKYVKYVTMSMTTGSQLLFQVSTDGENWTTIYEYKDPRNDLGEAEGGRKNGGLEKALYTFDLTDAVVGEKGLTGDYIYIRIADSYPAAGWGGNLYYTPVTFEIIRNCVPHEVKLPEYGTTLEGWNWGSSLNHAQGSFSASKFFAANKELGAANILVNYTAKDGKGVDASTADTFEFDFYTSNAAAVKDIQVELELTSSGTCDDHEKRYVATLGALVEGGMKDGWNHIVLPISKMSDMDGNHIDWSNVNFFRQYFFAGVKTGENGLTLAYDNLIFTKDGETVATLSNAEPNTNGWEGPAMEMDGKLVIGNVITGNKFNVCDIYINYNGDAMDVSDMKYLEYDIYVSDVEALKNVTLYTEINSSGDYDKNELGYDKTFAAHGLQNGWNRIKIELAKMGDTAGNGACDLTSIKWVRLFTVQEADLTNGLTFAVTNVRFTDDQAPEIELPKNPEGGEVVPPACTEHVDADKNGKCDNCGADVPVEPGDVETKEDLYEFQIDNGAKEAPYLDPDYTANWNGTLRFADGSQYFQYKYDLTAFRGIQSITFSGNFGGQYHIWASADGKNWVEIAKRSETSPAKSLTLDLTVLAEEIAKTMTVYVRIGDSDTSNGNGGNMNGNVQLKVVYDANADQTRIEPEVVVEQEKISFKIETDDEKAYLIENTGKWNNVHRYADANAHYTYKYTVKNVNQVQKVIWKAKTCQEFKLDISFDNKNWQTVSADTSNTAPLMREYDLTSFLVKDGTIENATFYLKICDADTSDGWGGGIYGDAPVTLLVDYIPLTAEQMDAIEATKTEHRIPLWGANKSWGDIYVEDTENQVSGSACVSVNLKGVQGTHAPSKKFESVDATGMDTFEFYVYLSDLAIVDHLKNNTGFGSVEICSGGSCDQGEKAVSLNQIFTDFVVGELTTGWNQIAIPLDRMAATNGAYGAFELNNINYIRIFWSGMTNPTDQDWVMKFDDFCMTDRQAQKAAAEEAFRVEVLEKNAGLIANIDALKEITEITADNITSAKAKLSNVKSAFEALPKEEQDILIAAGYKKTINEFQKLVDAYVEAPECTEHVDADKNGKCDNCDADVEVKVECTEHVDADNNGKCDNCDATVEVGGGTTTTPGKNSCKSSMTIGAVATMILAGAWVSIAARKKED